MKHLLTIAGSDSSGGAGIQADLKTFAAHGVFGMSVITAVTAQNTCGVTAVQDIDPDIITAQIDAVFSDIRVDGVKIGMVSRTESIHAIAEALKKWKPPVVVVDPVMISKSGYPLLQPDACEALIKELLPLATLLTPNLPEAEAICGFAICPWPRCLHPTCRKRKPSAALPLKPNRTWKERRRTLSALEPKPYSSKAGIWKAAGQTTTCTMAKREPGCPAPVSRPSIPTVPAAHCPAL